MTTRKGHIRQGLITICPKENIYVYIYIFIECILLLRNYKEKIKKIYNKEKRE